MILLLGATGYIGSAFRREMELREIPFVAVRHTEWQVFAAHNPKIGAIINCAAFIPPVSVALCDIHQRETIQGNVLLPQLLAQHCEARGIILAHISTACLWSDGLEHFEADPPQRAFRGRCGFYIGTKVMAEECVRNSERHYIWRVRLPFDEVNHPRNYLSKLAAFDMVFDHENTLSHRRDFASACLDLLALRAPFGTYNVMNQGSVKATEIVERLLRLGLRKDRPEIIPQSEGGAKVGVLKLLTAGVEMRHVEEALDESLNHWKP